MFSEAKITKIYCMADDFCKEFVLQQENMGLETRYRVPDACCCYRQVTRCKRFTNPWPDVCKSNKIRMEHLDITHISTTFVTKIKAGG